MGTGGPAEEGTGRGGFPPPALPAPGAAREVRAALADLLRADPDRYAEFLLLGNPLRAGRGDGAPLALLAAAGLAAPGAKDLWIPRVRLFPLRGKWIATDLLARRTPDQVFSLMFEQVWLVRHMDVRPGDAVLEPCLGSGVNAIFAADRARAVTGTELNPRAAAFARFNAALNGASLEVLEGSLLEPVGERRFDLVVVNPPFELVPPGEEWFLHSHGGEDGLDVVRALLPTLPGRLAPGGRFEIISWSPARGEEPLLVDLLREALPNHDLAVHVLDGGPLGNHVEPFRGRPGYDAWLQRLADRGLDAVEFLFVHAEPGTGEVEVLFPEAEVDACHAVSDSWT